MAIYLPKILTLSYDEIKTPLFYGCFLVRAVVVIIVVVDLFLDA